MKPLVVSAFLCAVLTTSSAFASSHDKASTGNLTEGEVRKIDKEQGKITLKHGEIKNLDMPAMTMVFKVKDPAMLDKVKPGDHVKFAAERAEGALTVTRIEGAK